MSHQPSIMEGADGATGQDSTASATVSDFGSRHTENFAGLLAGAGISLAVSTYQAGKLIFLRADGERINTHFRNFKSPMGLAYDSARSRLAVGTRHEVWNFFNQPRVAEKLDTPNSSSKCDAAFLPQVCHFSGDIRIHEIAWLGTELWAVNTRFSCLCTFDAEHSFLPRWRPPFISALAPEDRCHLNGFCIQDNSIRFLSCLGLTDTADGWRVNKASGGALLDYPSGEPLLTGLSMPHSPRYYADRYWLLESGRGTLSLIDPQAGKIETVTKLPGFTRGLDFWGPYAFIGLSKVRESAVFSGIPIVEEIPERHCGVWVVDLRTGETAAYLQFDGTVQEIFSIQVLPNIAFPDLINESCPTLDDSFILPYEAIASM